MDGQVTTIAGEIGLTSTSSVDGTGAAASFAWPQALTSAPDGGLFAVDVLTSSIRHVTLSGSVTTVSHTYPQSGWIPWFVGIAVRQDGSLALSDQEQDFVMTMPGAGGAMTTLAGSGQSGGVDGNATSASFDAPTGMPGCISWPQAVAIDGHTLYITTARGVAVARGVP